MDGRVALGFICRTLPFVASFRLHKIGSDLLSHRRSGAGICGGMTQAKEEQIEIYETHTLN